MEQLKYASHKSVSSGNNLTGYQPLFNAWISPAGEIFEVDIGYHTNFVVDLLEKTYGKEYLLRMKLFSTDDFYSFMENRGWIRVTNWRSGEFNFIFPKKLRIPHTQIKAVVNMCIDYNIPLPDEVKE